MKLIPDILQAISQNSPWQVCNFTFHSPSQACQHPVCSLNNIPTKFPPWFSCMGFFFSYRWEDYAIVSHFSCVWNCQNL